jgi:drug/metabolite transporter (DMT)-like permease
MRTSCVVPIVLVVSAFLEVGGDAIIRKGLRGSSALMIITGAFLVGSYGIVVNTVKWDFSKLFGVYVAMFALISVLFGRYLFKEHIPFSTWLGLGIIIIGGLVIQAGTFK